MSCTQPADKYLLLIGFITFQTRQFEDRLTDSFLASLRTALSKAKKRHKDYLIDNYWQQQQTAQKAISLVLSGQHLIQKIRAILWTETEALQAEEKINHLKKLVPSQVDQESEPLRSLHTTNPKKNYYLDCLRSLSLSLQGEVSPIIKVLHFDQDNCCSQLLGAIQHFRAKNGKITNTAPQDFLKEEERAELSAGNRFDASSYKVLLFQAVYWGIKSGRLNLRYSYRYKAFDQYLIPQKKWQTEKKQLLSQANLADKSDWSERFNLLRCRLDGEIKQTNEQIAAGKNPHFVRRTTERYQIQTPKIERSKTEGRDVFPKGKIIPLTEILATVQRLVPYTDKFQNLQTATKKQRPGDNTFFAILMAYGCNLGLQTMSKVALNLPKGELENIAIRYLDLEKIRQATDQINNFTQRLQLPDLLRDNPKKLLASSDGQKFKIADKRSFDASFSYKYFGTGKGVSAYSFIDERFIPFYSTLIGTSEREAIFVLDGLLHNENIRPTIHSTDTHGYTEAIFGLMDLLGFGFAPRIARLYKLQLYSFQKIDNPQWPILPKGRINTRLIAENWEAILRLAASLRLKHCSASQIFKRLNSYSRQHPLYQALKEYGKIIKTIYVFRYIDQLQLRQAVQKQLNIVELSNRLSSAIFFANAREMIFSTHRQQLVAQASTNLIKAAIVCWNYLFLSRHIQSLSSSEEKQAFIDQIREGTTLIWRHIYFSGTYDFADDKLTDSCDLLTSHNFDLQLS